ncbi:MAG: RsmF rRNA methyltransferase first C-terminal domain-containing protein [Lachnospiraceae bacterium]|nr:RsmF rRNA methyltransferase first C-terminal domain-containing protein [Lachnospiraceae bacterium]
MLPEAYINRMRTQLNDEFDAFINSYEEKPKQALRLNTLKNGDVFKVCDKAFHLNSVEWALNGYYYDDDDQPGKHPYHEAGMYYIQEPSAMAPVMQLDVKPGDVVLDLCAAPGGKSSQIAGFLKGEGLLLCNEYISSRAQILSENIERMGIRNACVTNESPDRLEQFFPAFFDKILVDAPCSGEGMFRKNPLACDEWSEENVRMCAERQSWILDCAATMLLPGGRMVYSTCTFSKEEDEDQIEAFLERHKEFKLEKQEKLMPHRIKGEGHFVAVLIKDGENIQIRRGVSNDTSSKENKNLNNMISLWRSFAKETLTENAIDRLTEGKRYIAFGDNLYLVMSDLPQLKGVKVVRPGLQLGSIKKDRFEPAHALALALSCEEVMRSHSLSCDDRLSSAYLAGETFSAQGEKGWYLICVDGFSMGWGKLAGGIMKNHYPKGLRKHL